MVLLAAFLPLASNGCFGNFHLTQKIYGFNQSVSQDKWVRWLAFLVMIALPVYEFGFWLDALFFNSIEFWTGKNPVAFAPGTTHVVTGPDGATARLVVLGPDRAELELRDGSGRIHRLVLVREGDAVAALDEFGRELARVARLDGERVAVRAPAGAPPAI